MDIKVINSIRNLALDMINDAGSGHPGITLDAAPIIYTLFANHLVFNNDNPSWINRDRFVLSAGHASALLYSTLFFSGYPISLEELKKYRRIDGLPGHPSYNLKIGVEATTGSLGEGFATSVGLAIAEEYLRNLLGKEIINNYTYTLVSDGDLMEGISYEAASLAGSLKLRHLIVLYDSNGVTMDGKKDKRFEDMGWHTGIVNSGEDYSSIDKAILEAKASDKPSIIEVKTTIGIGTSIAGTNKVHSGPLSCADLNLVKEKMGITKVPYHISKEAYEYIRNKQTERNKKIYEEWSIRVKQILDNNPKKKDYLKIIENNLTNINFLQNIEVNYDGGMREDMRVTNSNLMKMIFDVVPQFIGGSSDMGSSTKTNIDSQKAFEIEDYTGRIIHFGVRENLMGAILNGLALSGFRPFGSTMLAFSDNLKPSMRLSAMMNLPVTYIFTHDSISIGYDGETHEPVEELGNIRSIPNMKVFRPADVNELVSSWNYILSNKCACSLILPKEDKGKLYGSNIISSSKGAYIIKREQGRLAGILIATGSEVETVLEISNELDRKGMFTRVISMPSIEVFNEQTDEYKNSLFETGTKIIAVEASNDKVWNVGPLILYKTRTAGWRNPIWRRGSG